MRPALARKAEHPLSCGVRGCSGLGFVDGGQHLQPQNALDAGIEPGQLGPQLDVPQQLTVHAPGEHMPQGQAGHGPQLDPGHAPATGHGVLKGLAADQVSPVGGAVHPQHNALVQAHEIPVPNAKARQKLPEQGLGLRQQRFGIAAPHGSLQYRVGRRLDRRPFELAGGVLVQVVPNLAGPVQGGLAVLTVLPIQIDTKAGDQQQGHRRQRQHGRPDNLAGQVQGALRCHGRKGAAPHSWKGCLEKAAKTARMRGPCRPAPRRAR